MATRYASNGFLRGVSADGSVSGVLAQTDDIQIDSDSNSEYVLTNTGESGPTTGISTCQLDVKSAVPRASTERKAIIRAYQAKQIFRFTYRSGDMDYVAEGIISKLKMGSQVNKKDTFDFTFMGTEQPIQDV